MESLIIPYKSTPQLTIPFDFSQNPIKSSTFSSKTHKLFSSKTSNFNQITHFLKNGNFNEALTTLDSITSNGSKLKADIFTQFLDFSINFNAIELGKALHCRIHLVEDVGPFVETKLVSMYAKCGSLSNARKVFDEMSERNLFTWSAMIGAYARKKRWGEVVMLFGLMMGEGVLPDKFLFPKILQACGNCGEFELGRLIHSLVIRSGMSSCRRVNNALLAVYAKCCKMSLARQFFEEMDERDIVSWNSVLSGYCRRGENDEARRFFNMMCEEGIEPSLMTWNILISGYNQSGDCDAAMEVMDRMRGFGISPDVFTWTSMISGLSQNSRVFEALELFREMLLVGVQPNGVTIASAISACASVNSLEKGIELHSVASKMGLSNNVLAGNALIDMYSKCGELDSARKVFDLMSEKDVYTWNSMIGGYCQGGYCGKAHELFLKMQNSETSPNVVTWNVIISGFIQNGDEDQAMELFQTMDKMGLVKPETSSWNSLISGYLQLGRKNEALMVFRQMQAAGYRPNSVTILTILPACGNVISENKVKEIHACVLRGNLDSHIAISNSLIDIYSKSGNLAYSRYVFSCLASKDIITWNSIIATYVLHGHSNEAIDAFDLMTKQGYRPNRGTFVSVILACSHGKMAEKGKEIFSRMTRDYQILPSLEHYAAMIDLFGRSGRLNEAIEFIDFMEIEPDLAVWDALLTASRYHGNIALIIRAIEHMFDLNAGNSVLYHLITQAYMACGRSVDTLKERRALGNIELKKPCGSSLLKLKRQVYSFYSGDHSTPGLDNLSNWLKIITRNVELPNSSNKHIVHEEDSEEICGLHSEKLALSFALINSNFEVKCIRIVKNFRTCEDCHCTAKYISSAYGCEILLNDTKHLHHFKNGHCSCGDYW